MIWNPTSVRIAVENRSHHNRLRLFHCNYVPPGYTAPRCEVGGG